MGKRWKLDLHSYQDASLQLSAVHLPGGVQVKDLLTLRLITMQFQVQIVCIAASNQGMQCVVCIVRLIKKHSPSSYASKCLPLSFAWLQRRRTVEDELNMRGVYQEGDLISVSSSHRKAPKSALTCPLQFQNTGIGLTLTYMAG